MENVTITVTFVIIFLNERDVLCFYTESKNIFSIFNGYELKNLPFLTSCERMIQRTFGKEVFIMSEKSMKSKQDAFCCWYVMLGNAAEAAEKAGFPKENALGEAVRCLRSQECRKTISSLRELLSDSGNVAAGLKRLAFGSCTDAVYLVFADELPPPSVIDGLDLFNVSEIKRIKGGGVEIKLFDRLKALEKLFELEKSCSDHDKAADLIRALTEQTEESDSIEDNQAFS